MKNMSEKLFFFSVLLLYYDTSIDSRRIFLSCQQKRQLVDGHNLRRQWLAQCLLPRQPCASQMHYMVSEQDFLPSTNAVVGYTEDRGVVAVLSMSGLLHLRGKYLMKKMYSVLFRQMNPNKQEVWDEELSEKASKWAEHQQFAHNPNRTVASQRWPLIGENVHISKFYSPFNLTVIPNIEEALNNWFKEHFDYTYETFDIPKGIPTGHYTQMVWSHTNRVGCGASQWKENGWTHTLFVCDYGPTGNYLKQHPYAIGNGPRYLVCPDGFCKQPYGPYC